MQAADFRIVPLSSEHDRLSFTCGVDSLDNYLRQSASQDLRRQLSAIFVLIDNTNYAIAGYYTLSACNIEPSSLPPKWAKRLPRRPAPATLIGRLAVDLRYRRRRLGEALLSDALIRAATVSREVGSMAVVVDAKDGTARSFYERYGFQRFADYPFRLFLPMADAAQGIGTE